MRYRYKKIIIDNTVAICNKKKQINIEEKIKKECRDFVQTLQNIGDKCVLNTIQNIIYLLYLLHTICVCVWILI